METTGMQKIPWYIWLSVLGVTSAMIGVHWDISWHRSIGRDTFWTPAHIAIQLCGVIAGITCGYLILWTTFTQSQLRAASVNVLGFRGPLGAFICAWGGFAMIASAPFDDWWHNAYGLDVKILSPPHVALAIGMVAVEIGAMVLIAAGMNRAEGKARRGLELLFLYVNSMILVALLVLVLEFTHRVFLHTAIAYRSIRILTPIVLAIAPRATGSPLGRYPCQRDLYGVRAGTAVDSSPLPGRTDRTCRTGAAGSRQSSPDCFSSLCSYPCSGRLPISCNPPGPATPSSAASITTTTRVPRAMRRLTGS
jgi:hypothetical protein